MNIQLLLCGSDLQFLYVVKLLEGREGSREAGGNEHGRPCKVKVLFLLSAQYFPPLEEVCVNEVGVGREHTKLTTVFP